MPWTAPKTWHVGDEGISADLNTYVRDNENALYTPPYCRVYRNANQSIPATTNTAIVFNQERSDTTNMHDVAVNNTRITIALPGLYMCGYSVQFAVHTASPTYMWVQGSIRATFAAGGNAFIESNNRNAHSSTAPATKLSGQTCYRFAAGDYIELFVYQYNGVPDAVNVEYAASYSPELWALWVSG